MSETLTEATQDVLGQSFMDKLNAVMRTPMQGVVSWLASTRGYPSATVNIQHFQTLISAISIHQCSQHECKCHISYSCHLCIPHPALSLSSIMFCSPFNFSEVLCTDSGTSLSALWWLWVLLYGYGTVWNAGCHSWNPLIVLFSHCNPLTEGYEYDRQSSVLILEIWVYTCRIVSSIGGTSRATPSAGFVCIKTPVQ